MTSFNDFGLAEPIVRAIAEEKYETPTPIQAQTVPAALTRRDVVGIAQTGTGKTAAFALPILHHLHAERRSPARKSCRVLVLSPTRELSGQIQDSFRTYGRHVRVSTALAIGGVPMGKQVRTLMDGVDVLVATPGRLLDLVKGNALKLDHVEILVLDEADRMLDMGFIHDIRKIVAKLPQRRQTLFFSATMPRDIAELADAMLRDPVKVAVTPVASTAERIAQRIIHVDRAAKAAVLADVLRQETIDRALVFTRTKHGADKVVRQLVRSGIPAEAIHGNKSQGQRERVLAAFRKGEVRTLVATDIAARGIDVDGISHVVNYDLPNVPETYVHRIGRTARAGAEGVAISLCDGEERAYVRDIERLIRMAIPATDQRGAPRPAQQPASDRGGATQGRPHGRPNGKPQGGQRSHSNGKPRNGHVPHDGQRQHGGQRQQDGQRQHAGQHRRGDQRQHAGQHQQGGHRQQGNPVRYGAPRPGGQRPQTDGQPQAAAPSHKPGRRDERRQRPERRPPHNDGDIGAVAFMQRSGRSQRNSDGRAPR